MHKLLLHRKGKKKDKPFSHPSNWVDLSPGRRRHLPFIHKAPTCPALRPYPNKDHYTCQIPAVIFQTWHTKEALPPLMFAAIQQIRVSNPGFKHYLYDDQECRDFIQKHYDRRVLNAFDSLVPGAFKADLWRYCVLFQHGGIYLDIKYVPINQFRLINLLESEHWVLDVDQTGIYNAVMVCRPGCPRLKKAIDQVVHHVETKYYGHGFLDPTGPQMLSKLFNDSERRSFDMRHELRGGRDCDKYVTFNGWDVLQCYPGYTKERDNNSLVPHYGTLWNQRAIYR